MWRGRAGVWHGDWSTGPVQCKSIVYLERHRVNSKWRWNRFDLNSNLCFVDCFSSCAFGALRALLLLLLLLLPAAVSASSASAASVFVSAPSAAPHPLALPFYTTWNATRFTCCDCNWIAHGVYSHSMNDIDGIASVCVSVNCWCVCVCIALDIDTYCRCERCLALTNCWIKVTNTKWKHL